MAAGGPVQDLCDEATCPICLDYFADPVTIAECGHNFCRACLARHWEEEEAEANAFSCPQCRETVQERPVVLPNRQLKNIVEIAKKLRLQEQGRAREAAEGVCEKHQQPLKLFCKDHEAPLCLVCDGSKEHGSHTVVPREKTFQEYKDQIHRSLKTLKAEREKIFMYKADAKNESQDLFKQIQKARQKITGDFQRIRLFLDKDEKRLLAQMDEVEKEIAKRRDVHMARLSRALSSLEKIIEEMEEKCQQPASEFLQDVGNILQRYENDAFQKLVAFPPELKCRIRAFYNRKPLLEGVVNQFKGVPTPTFAQGLCSQRRDTTDSTFSFGVFGGAAYTFELTTPPVRAGPGPRMERRQQVHVRTRTARRRKI